jgi:aspartate racemase
MKTIGIIGGLSWFSTLAYYQTINQLTNRQIGASHSAKMIIYSVDFNDFKQLQDKNDWDGIEKMLVDIAKRLENAGAECIVLASNTPHIVADNVSLRIGIPLLNIAEITAKEIAKHGFTKVGLLGTKFTMEHAFFKDRLNKFGIDTSIPETSERTFIHNSIFNELTEGIFLEETRKEYIRIIDKMKIAGAQGIIFGCTEIVLLLAQDDCNLKVFDTKEIHCQAAVEFALSDSFL